MLNEYMPRAEDFERANKPGRTRAEDAERKRRERAERARREGRPFRAGSAGRVAKRNLVDVFGGDGPGESLRPRHRAPGEWIAKGEWGMRFAFERAFDGPPLPCRLRAPSRSTFACIVRRLPPTVRDDEIREAQRRLAVEMTETMRRCWPDVRVVICAVPRRIAADGRRVGMPGVAVLMFIGARLRPRDRRLVERAERVIAARCAWRDAEAADGVPFSDDWRVLGEDGANLHRPKRGAGQGARRRADLAWLSREAERLSNHVAAFDLDPGGAGFGTPIGTTSGVQVRETSCPDRRPKSGPAARENRLKTRAICDFVVAASAA